VQVLMAPKPVVTVESVYEVQRYVSGDEPVTLGLAPAPRTSRFRGRLHKPYLTPV
jgi:hypothetical protein